MTSASPAFQGDRPDSPGFQLAEDAGFQTQGAACLGELGVVVGLSSVTSGPTAPPVWWRPGVLLEPRRPAVVGALGVVVALTSASRFTTRRERLEQDDAEVLELLLGGGRAASVEAYVRAVVIPDDAEVLELLLLAARASSSGT